jgi:predicted MFS family arabinose efflux permease
MLRAYFSRLPLTDRVTHWWDLWAGLAYGVFSGGCLVFLSVAARRVGVSDVGMAVMLTMPYVGMLSGVLLGHLADRHGPMPFYLWPTLASRTVLLALPLVNGPAGFLAVASAFNLLANMASPAYASIMRSNFSDEHRGRLMGNVRVLIVVVAAAASWVAGAVLERWPDGWRWLFAAAAAVGIVATLFFSRIRPRHGVPAAGPAGGPRRRPGLVASLGALRRDGAFLAFLAIVFVCALPGKLAAALEPIRFVDELKIGWQDSGLVLGTVVSLVGVVGYLAWPRLLKRVDPFALLALVTALMAARFGVIAAATRPLHLVPAGVLAGLAGGGWELVFLFCIMRLADSGRFSVAMGLHTTLVGVRGLFGPGLGTWLSTSDTLSLPTIFWLLAGVTLTGAAGMLWYSIRLRRVGAAAEPAVRR